MISDFRVLYIYYHFYILFFILFYILFISDSKKSLVFFISYHI